ncbi:amidophosphoribosyltransferase [Trichonephila clavipes]|nr:amidophosphoribosyltransferase [Trichonephila clavipes]
MSLELSELNSEELREACGLFGCIATGKWPTNLDVSHIIYLGMIALQHRGQESCGIVTSNGDQKQLQSHKGSGLVNHSFKEDDLAQLKGNLGIGHTRYSTLGGTEHLNTQPFVVNMKQAKLALAHNGELVNASELRKVHYDILEVQGVEKLIVPATDAKHSFFSFLFNSCLQYEQ